MPERSASSAASASAAVVVPTISWLQALASDPDAQRAQPPDGGSHGLESGCSRAEVRFASAPAMMARVPFVGTFGAAADWGVHHNGVAALASRTRRPNARTLSGETLLMTTTAVPGAGGVSAQLASSPAAASSM